MKTEKGITLMSLIIYIILMCIVVGMLSIISNLFFSNTSYLTENSKNIAEYNKFAMYFIEDVKNNKSMKKVTSNEVEFEDGTIYTFKESPDESIYRNQVKICRNIGYCKFSQKEEIVNNTTKKIIQVHMIIKASKLFETNHEYVLKYW